MKLPGPGTPEGRVVEVLLERSSLQNTTAYSACGVCDMFLDCLQSMIYSFNEGGIVV